MHLRLSDESDRSSKGLDASRVPELLLALLPRLGKLEAAGDARPVSTLYVASNRPSAVARLMPAISSLLGAKGVRVRGWHGLEPAARTGGHPPLTGLRAALVEHELCVLAPLGFAGSPFSTWANLIGARRWLAGRTAGGAYIDLRGGSLVPPCASSTLGNRSSFSH